MPFCPNCRAAFNKGPADCPDCGVPLVESLEEGESADFVEVFRAQSVVEAETIQTALQDDGIECFLRNTGIPAMPLMGEEGSIVVEVRADQAAAAREIIDEIESAPPPEIDENAGGDAEK